MPAITIERDEFETFLDSFVSSRNAYVNNVDEQGVYEHIYYIASPALPTDIVLRVCSSINTENQQSRDTGEDSIKAMLWHTEYNKPVGGREYTQRIETWKQNLEPKLAHCLDDWDDLIQFCPHCNVPLLIRNGPYGTFRSCLNYPDCEYKN